MVPSPTLKTYRAESKLRTIVGSVSEVIEDSTKADQFTGKDAVDCILQWTEEYMVRRLLRRVVRRTKIVIISQR